MSFKTAREKVTDLFVTFTSNPKTSKYSTYEHASNALFSIIDY